MDLPPPIQAALDAIRPHIVEDLSSLTERSIICGNQWISFRSINGINQFPPDIIEKYDAALRVLEEDVLPRVLETKMRKSIANALKPVCERARKFLSHFVTILAPKNPQKFLMDKLLKGNAFDFPIETETIEEMMSFLIHVIPQLKEQITSVTLSVWNRPDLNSWDRLEESLGQKIDSLAFIEAIYVNFPKIAQSPENPYLESVRDARLPTKGSISEETRDIFEFCVKLLGLEGSKEFKCDLRLACLAYLLKEKSHSVADIAHATIPYGIGFVNSPEYYTHLSYFKQDNDRLVYELRAEMENLGYKLPHEILQRHAFLEQEAYLRNHEKGVD